MRAEYNDTLKDITPTIKGAVSGIFDDPSIIGKIKNFGKSLANVITLDTPRLEKEYESAVTNIGLIDDVLNNLQKTQDATTYTQKIKAANTAWILLSKTIKSLNEQYGEGNELAERLKLILEGFPAIYDRINDEHNKLKKGFKTLNQQLVDSDFVIRRIRDQITKGVDVELFDYNEQRNQISELYEDLEKAVEKDYELQKKSAKDKIEDAVELKEEQYRLDEELKYERETLRKEEADAIKNIDKEQLDYRKQVHEDLIESIKEKEEELANRRKELHEQHFERILSAFDFADKVRNRDISEITGELNLNTDIDKLTDLSISGIEAKVNKARIEIEKLLGPLGELDEGQTKINFTGSILPPPPKTPEPTLEEKKIAEHTEKTADNTEKILETVKGASDKKQSTSQATIPDTSVGRFRALEAAAIEKQNNILENIRNISVDRSTIIDRIQGHEGGLDETDQREGGTSYAGITQKYYDKWRKAAENATQDLPNQVKDLKGQTDLINKIYDDYLNEHFVDLMPNYMQYIYSDFAFNSGERALKTIQKILGVSRKGELNDITKKAIAEWKAQSDAALAGDAAIAKDFIQEFHDLKIDFYEWLVRKDPEQYEKYIKGWKERANDVLKTALADLENNQKKSIKDIEAAQPKIQPPKTPEPQIRKQENIPSQDLIEPVIPESPKIRNILKTGLPELKILEIETEALLADLPKIEATLQLEWEGFDNKSAAVGDIPSVAQIPEKSILPIKDTSVGRFREIEASQSNLIKELTQALIDPVIPESPSIRDISESALPQLKVEKLQTDALLADLPEINVTTQLQWDGF